MGMSRRSVADAVKQRYSDVAVRGCRIARLDEALLSTFQLDGCTAWELGRNNTGLFVGGCQDFDRAIRIVRPLKCPTEFLRWVLVVDSKLMAMDIAQQWFESPRAQLAAKGLLVLPLSEAGIILALPESLRRVDEQVCGNVAGIILVDILCHIHKARGMDGGKFSGNDRPQHVVTFRNRIAEADWLPPLVFLTAKPAKSLPTDAIARAYCLDAWWFIDGRSLECGAME